MTKHQKMIDFVTTEIPYIARLNNPSSEILDKVRQMSDTYRTYIDYQGYIGLDYTEWDSSFMRNTRRVHNLYSPKITPALAKEGILTIYSVNKKGGRTGKQVDVKMGRYLTMAYPFLSDVDKETIVTYFKDNFAELNVEMKWADTGFGDIVTLPQARSSFFSTTYWYKSLSDSCMRYTKDDLGFSDYHPYDAYCSGDFKLGYLEKDGKLYGRVLVNPATMTHSALYGVSQPAIELMKAELKKLGYSKVDDDDCKSWIGQRLLYLTDTYDHEDEGPFSVIVTPYLDFLEDEDGWSDGEYIYINYKPKDRMRRVDLQDASGYNEL